MLDKAALSLALLLAACGGGDQACPFQAPADPAAFRLDLLDEFTSGIQPGDMVTAHQGPQGGFHILLAVRSEALYPGDLDATPSTCGSNSAPCVDITIEDLSAGRVIDAFAPLAVPLGCTTARSALRQVVLDIDSLADVDGHTLRIQASATDAFGTRVDADLTVTCAAGMMTP